MDFTNFYNFSFSIFSRLFDIFYTFFNIAWTTPNAFINNGYIPIIYDNPFAKILGENSVRVSSILGLGDVIPEGLKNILNWLQEIPFVGSIVNGYLDMPLILCILALFGLVLFIVIIIKVIKLFASWF